MHFTLMLLSKLDVDVFIACAFVYSNATVPVQRGEWNGQFKSGKCFLSPTIVRTTAHEYVN